MKKLLGSVILLLLLACVACATVEYKPTCPLGQTCFDVIAGGESTNRGISIEKVFRNWTVAHPYATIIDTNCVAAGWRDSYSCTIEYYEEY